MSLYLLAKQMCMSGRVPVVGRQSSTAVWHRDLKTFLSRYMLWLCRLRQRLYHVRVHTHKWRYRQIMPYIYIFTPHYIPATRRRHRNQVPHCPSLSTSIASALAPSFAPPSSLPPIAAGSVKAAEGVIRSRNDVPLGDVTAAPLLLDVVRACRADTPDTPWTSELLGASVRPDCIGVDVDDGVALEGEAKAA
jgi:hypothetical protein